MTKEEDRINSSISYIKKFDLYKNKCIRGHFKFILHFAKSADDISGKSNYLGLIDSLTKICLRETYETEYSEILGEHYEDFMVFNDAFVKEIENKKDSEMKFDNYRSIADLADIRGQNLFIKEFNLLKYKLMSQHKMTTILTKLCLQKVYKEKLIKEDPFLSLNTNGIDVRNSLFLFIKVSNHIDHFEPENIEAKIASFESFYAENPKLCPFGDLKNIRKNYLSDFLLINREKRTFTIDHRIMKNENGHKEIRKLLVFDETIDASMAVGSEYNWDDTVFAQLSCSIPELTKILYEFDKNL